jgi:hypothetical protein
MGKITLLGPVFVRHYPSGYGNGQLEELWKQAVADECRINWGERHLLKKPVSLKLKFYLSSKRDLDLTGMLETTVNGVANVIFPMAHQGGHKTKWHHEDRWVYTIEASKEFRDIDPGVEIVVQE